MPPYQLKVEHPSGAGNLVACTYAVLQSCDKCCSVCKQLSRRTYGQNHGIRIKARKGPGVISMRDHLVLVWYAIALIIPTQVVPVSRKC